MIDLHKSATFVRWFARIWASLILSFLLFFVIGHMVGPEEGSAIPTNQDLLTFVFFPFGTMLGLALAFKWEGLGGLITLLSQGVLFLIRPDLLEVVLIAMASGPAILYLMYWIYSRRYEKG